MYADSELMFPYFQNFSLEVEEPGDYFKSQKSDSSLTNLIQPTTVSDYDLGAEGDLFKAPEPIIEEPLGGLDPLTAAISMISCGEDVITSQGLDIADIESMQNEQLWSEVFYECKKDLLEKAAIESPLSEILDIKIPVVQQCENQGQGNESLPDVSFQKSVSSGCLSSVEWVHGNTMKPNFVDFPVVDFGAVYGMRRAFSEGDIKTLSNFSMSFKERSCSNEERREKLSRYWNKKSKRNFGRKIKYACRKALADSQPRIRGRFAKTEDSESSKRG